MCAVTVWLLLCLFYDALLYVCDGLLSARPTAPLECKSFTPTAAADKQEYECQYTNLKRCSAMILSFFWCSCVYEREKEKRKQESEDSVPL